MKIIVDMMGGDNAPLAVLEGAAQAVKEYGVTVVGIRHAGQIIPSPGGDAFLRGGETVFLYASPASLPTVMPFFRTNPEPERAEDL